ncbi:MULTISPECIES: hypothetical protein [unclassified Halomonas]|uniref:hypothetical protein n=1 Tax=unclassified Halomonas TaxID=2609666 RepID=UPI0006DB493C|nr:MULTISPECIES: hypothetical protein [unclassified Halomonas]KPQ19644.1 MAG: hypothetical protein HLUCCO06_01230 [Halomonas sp. HL-93]SBR51956.1 hypothetical protein GA0071314_3449 [Halomonas sp. HL-93]SNY98229.1 hypothetical protein SAMN04488142_2849 [Halomonas sp. hl-4]
MSHSKSDVSLYEVVYEVIPNLNIAEKLVNNTLKSLREEASNPLDMLRRKEQQEALGLEIHHVRMNLEHLLERYRDEVAELVRTEGREKGPIVTPDPFEAQAIRSAVDIYQHVRAYQRGERRHPLPGR